MSPIKMTFEDFQIYHAHEIEALFAMINDHLTQGHSHLIDFVDFCYANTSLEKPRDYREVMTEYYETESPE